MSLRRPCRPPAKQLRHVPKTPGIVPRRAALAGRARDRPSRVDFRNGPLGVKPPSDDLATVIVLPSVVDTRVATSCHQMGTSEPILSTGSCLCCVCLSVVFLVNQV